MLLLYVGDEVVAPHWEASYEKDILVKKGGFSLSNLGWFQYPFMWKIMPGYGMKVYKDRLLEPIVNNRKTQGQKYVCHLAMNLHALNGAKVTVITECVDGKLNLPASADLIELRGNVNHLVCSGGHAVDMAPSDQLEKDDLICGECGKPFLPGIYLGSDVDNSALEAAHAAIDGLQNVNGAIIVLGACGNSVIRQELINKHKNEQVNLFQISSSGIISCADVVRAAPRDVLFEIVEELDE